MYIMYSTHEYEFQFLPVLKLLQENNLSIKMLTAITIKKMRNVNIAYNFLVGMYRPRCLMN